jgi:hypothetical protein
MRQLGTEIYVLGPLLAGGERIRNAVKARVGHGRIFVAAKQLWAGDSGPLHAPVLQTAISESRLFPQLPGFRFYRRCRFGYHRWAALIGIIEGS